MPLSLRLEDHVFRIAAHQAVIGKLLEHAAQGWQWDADLDRAELAFCESGTGRILYGTAIQLIGTLSRADSSFLWGWNNPTVSRSAIERFDALREAAKSGSDARFLAEAPLLLSAEARLGLVTTAAGAIGAYTYYAASTENTVAFFALADSPAITPETQTPLSVIQTINGCLTAFSFSHRDAVYSYLGMPKATVGSTLTEDTAVFRAGTGDLRINFDDQGRIQTMEAQLLPSSAPAAVLPQPAPDPEKKPGFLQKLFGKK